jgi:hypothetical protein
VTEIKSTRHALGSASRADDALTEYMVALCYQRMLNAVDTTDQMLWFNRLAYHVGCRSPERIRQMEQQKGIAR